MKFNNINVSISPSAKIGKNVKIGDNTIIYDNVEIGDNSIICNNCVIGEPSNAYYQNQNYVNPKTVIGENALVRSHCLIYSGSTFGKNLITGHNAIIREGAIVGENCLLSTLVDIQGNCKIGDYSRIYSNVHIGELTEIGKFVFVFPFCMFANDPLPPSNQMIGSKVGDYSIITIHCSILPGVEVGSNCLIGANSVISKNIPNDTFAVGSPAKSICSIQEIKSKEKDGFHYPWMNNFERGMPWSGIGYNTWLNTQTNK